MHHIFGGADKKKSERYNLLVPLCHSSCHIFGAEAVHHNAQTMKKLRQWGQNKAMAENNWTIDDFRRVFGRNYLD